MSSLPLPNESARLAALARYRIFDSAPSASFDNIVYLGARVAGASMAYLAFLDDRREWCKARFAWPTPEVPRAYSLSAAVLDSGDVLVVSDACADTRFADHPWVCSERHLRSFVCVPLMSPEGFALGSLTVADREPREFSSVQIQALRTLAREAVELLEQRREDIASAPAVEIAAVVAASPAPPASPRSMPTPAAPASWPHWWTEVTPIAAVQLDAHDRLASVNPAWCALLGYSAEEAAALALSDVLHPADWARQREAMDRLRRGELAQFTAEQRYISKSRATIWVRARTLLPPGSAHRLILAEDISERKRAETEVRLLQGLILAAGGASDTAGALRIALYQICDAAGWDLGQAWIPTPNDRVLRLSTATYARDGSLERFRYLQADLTWSRGEGLPGRAWATGAAQWLNDAWSDGAFRRQQAARDCGLRAALAAPVAGVNGVAAVLEFFAREPRAPDARLLQIAATVAAQLGTTLRRRQAEEMLRAHDARLRLVVEHLPVVAWTADPRLHVTSVHGAAAGRFDPRALLAQPENTPLVTAHRFALAGETRQCDLEEQGRAWRVFLAPIPGEDGGVAGLALEREASGASAADRAAIAQLAAALAAQAGQLLAMARAAGGDEPPAGA